MNVAILIDAENVLPAHAEQIFNTAASLGPIAHKEIYGAAAALSTWVAPVLRYAIHPNLTIKAAKGKNSSDIALVIGAMDLLLKGDVSHVVIASSDSDFSALSVRLRNAGVEVVGMGQDKANELWRTACSQFVVLQLPTDKPRPAESAPSRSRTRSRDKEAPAAGKPAAPKAIAPRQSASKPAKAVTHEDRVAAVQAQIERQLRSHGGRMEVSTLFPALNKLPEYREDRQDVSMKPQNYVTNMFKEVFAFESTEDGKVWVMLADYVRPEPSEAAAVLPEEAPQEAQPEMEAPEAAETPAEPESSAPEAAEPQPEAAAEPDREVALLVQAGLPEEAAGHIAEIFRQSSSLRSAYNRLRSEYGNALGREYYLKVKEAAGAE